jgi:hypothetical protein
MGLPIRKYVLLSGVMLVPDPAQAQQIDSEWSPMDASETVAIAPAGDAAKDSRRLQQPRVAIAPYLEVSQILVADLNAGGEVLTYSSVVAGLDAAVGTRQAQGQVSLRVERRIAGSNRLNDQNVINGIARASVALTRNFSMEAGGVAARTRGDGRGPATSNFVGNTDNVADVFSIYGGPTFSAQAENINVNADYRAGYTKVESQRAAALPAGQQRIDQFDDSVSQVAAASVGAEPGQLPFGWTVSGSWKREDSSQLNSRFDARTVRGDVTWPLSPNLALVAGAGFEEIQIKERDALRDASGFPLVEPDGRLRTDPASPYLIAYHESGLIWDAGVLWRPGPRTSFEARFGRRYGTDTYVGSFNYRPARDWAMSVSVFDTISGFGGLLNDSLSALPTQFRTPRNPLSGDFGGCVFGQAGGSCLNDTLQNATSVAFRHRGVAGAFSGTIDGWDTGFALGLNHRSFIAPPLGAQAEMDGLKDNSYFAVASLGRNFGQRTRFESNFYASYLDARFAGALDTLSTGANAALSRQIVRGLSASAAVGLDHDKQEAFDSEVTASALLGLRYSF